MEQSTQIKNLYFLKCISNYFRENSQSQSTETVFVTVLDCFVNRKKSACEPCELANQFTWRTNGTIVYSTNGKLGIISEKLSLVLPFLLMPVAVQKLVKATIAWKKILISQRKENHTGLA